MITITLVNPSTIRLAFPYNAIINAIIVAFVKSLAGAQFAKDASKTWTTPLNRFEEIEAKFGPYLEVDYAVFQALDDRPRRFAQALLDMGVKLYLHGDSVIAEGAVSPLLQQEIDKRGAQIAELLRNGRLHSPGSVTPVTPRQADMSLVTEYELRMYQIIANGINNARKAEERKERTGKQRQTNRKSQQEPFRWNK